MSKKDNKGLIFLGLLGGALLLSSSAKGANLFGTDRFGKYIDVIMQNEGGYNRAENANFGVQDIIDGKADGRIKINGINVAVKDLTKEQASSIYRNLYFDKMRINEFKDNTLALHLFDMSVNAGVAGCTRLLCEVLKLPKQNYPTTELIRIANNREGLGAEFVRKRRDFYRSIAVGKKAKFLNGWLNRVDYCNKFV